MIVPNYWAEARASVRVKGRSITLRRFGWSDDSPADAQAQAELRVAEAAQLAASGQPVERRERKLAYNGAEGLRLIATHARLAPTSEASRAFFDAAGTDPVYVRMCLNQHCFRARLSAKPWRSGTDDASLAALVALHDAESKALDGIRTLA